MADPNRDDFYGRVARLEQAHARGHGHEAAGALGRSAYFRPSPRRLPVLRGSVFVLATVIGLKATLYGGMPEDVYLSRLAALKQGTAIERVGAFLMTPDPVTGWLADIWRDARGLV
ncbi:MAG: hypothetical protein CFE34_06060 [Rhodobacteraceae bacterium PARR1]|nr:MAG: hypothetical protein CFE34_06060 [Rhodobacteraceae bacterium PARR1]